MGMSVIKKWNGIKNNKRKVWWASLLIVMMLSSCAKQVQGPGKEGNIPPSSETSNISTAAPNTPIANGTAQNEVGGAGPVEPADPTTLKYYNYFVEHHTLVDNRVFTVNDNTLQDDVIYFAFMNTEPAEGKQANIRTKKQIDDVVMKYFGIKPKRYNTGISSVTSSGEVQTFSVIEGVNTVNRLLLKQLTDKGNGSYSGVFKLYQIQAGRDMTDFDQKILSGDPEMEMYHKMDIRVTFTEVQEGEAFYLKFSEFTLIPRAGSFVPPPQETEYIKKVNIDEIKSLHGLSIGMTLDEAKKLLDLPEGAYEYNVDSTLVNVDGWSYTFRTLPKDKSSDINQYLVAMNIRDYLDVIFRDIKLGDTYKDVIKKFPSAKEDGQTIGAPYSYFTKDYAFASTLRNVDIFTGKVHISMIFGRYNTLAWMDIYSTDY